MTERAVTCPTDEVLAAWNAGALHGHERDEVDRHAAGCARCRALAIALAGVWPHHQASGLGAEGATIDRYRIIGSIGQGAMGLVLHGHDPVLDRDVAIKMLASSQADPAECDQRERMLKEARAIARLDHPNVVRVFDAGVVGDEVFVAMEYVTGETLTRWLAGGKRSPAERISVLASVGAGIAAVHAAGLVHRDIKPDNILVRESGAAVLIDFGLARGSATTGAAGSGLAGTPRYLAPELRTGAVATSESDQFAWWTVVEDTLRDAKLPIANRRAIDRAIVRGCSAAPGDRFASMTDAIAALTRRRRARWPYVATAAGVLALVAGVGVLVLRAARRDDCASSAEALWRDHRPAIAPHLAAAGADAPRVLAALDARTTRTAVLHGEACRAARASDRDDRVQAMRRQLCVDQSWIEAARLFPGLEDSDREVVRSAIDELIEVLPVERCAHGALPAIPAPPPPEKLGEAKAIEAELRSIQLGKDGNPTRRLDRLRALEARIGALGHPQTVEAWHMAVASELAARGQLTEAQRELELAIQLAETAGDDDARARGLINRLRLAMTMGQTDTSAIERAAEAAASRLGNPAIIAQLDASEGLVRFAHGDPQGALDAMRAGQRQLDAIAIDAHRQLVTVAQNLAALEQTAGDLHAAQATFDRGLELARMRFGATASETLAIRGARATNFMYAGDVAHARPELAAVADALEQALGPRSEQVVQARSHLCEADLELDPATAEASCDAALASATRVFGDAHPQLIWQLELVGQQRLELHRYADALQLLERALTLAERGAIGPSDRPLAEAYLALALHGLQREPARATALARDAAKAMHGMPDKREILAKLGAAFPP